MDRSRIGGRSDHKVTARHSRMRRRNRNAVARANVGRSHRDIVRVAVIRRRTTAERDGNGSCGNGPSCGARLNLIIGAEVLRRDRNAVIVHGGARVSRRRSKSCGTRRRSIGHRDRNAVARVNAGNGGNHAVSGRIVNGRAAVVDKRERRTGKANRHGSALDRPSVGVADRDHVVTAPVAGSARNERSRSRIVARSGLAVVTERETYVIRINGVHQTGVDFARRTGLIQTCGHALRGSLINTGKARRIGPSHRYVLCGDLPYAGSFTTVGRNGVIARRGTRDRDRRLIRTNRDMIGRNARACRNGILREHGITGDYVRKAHGSTVLRSRVVNFVRRGPATQHKGARADRIRTTCRSEDVSVIGNVPCKDVCSIRAYVLLNVITDKRAIGRTVHVDDGA